MLIFTPNWFRYRLLGPSHPGISKLAHAALLHFSVGTGTNLLSWASLRHADNCLSLGASQASQKLALAKKSFVGASRCFESGLCAKLALAKTTFVGASQVRRNWLSQTARKDCLRGRFSGVSQLVLAKTTFVGTAFVGASQVRRNWLSQRPLSCALPRFFETGSCKYRFRHFRVRFSGVCRLYK